MGGSLKFGACVYADSKVLKSIALGIRKTMLNPSCPSSVVYIIGQVA